MEKFLTGNEVIQKYPIQPFQLVELVRLGLTPLDPKNKRAVLTISEEQYDYLHEKGDVPWADRCLTTIINATHEALVRKDMELGDALFMPDFTEHQCLVLRESDDVYHRLLEFVYAEEQVLKLVNEQDLETAEPTPEKKPKRHAKISQQEAARMCGVSRGTIGNWEKGRATPDGYPGRNDRSSLLIWSNDYRQQKALKRETRAINRARSMDPQAIGQTANKSALDDN